MKKIDWNVPMTRKNWVQLYAWSVGIIAAFYGLLWVWGTFTTRKASKKMEQVQEEDEEPYFDDEE